MAHRATKGPKPSPEKKLKNISYGATCYCSAAWSRPPEHHFDVHQTSPNFAEFDSAAEMKNFSESVANSFIFCNRI
jgi:hypothetical protein